MSLNAATLSVVDRTPTRLIMMISIPCLVLGLISVTALLVVLRRRRRPAASASAYPLQPGSQLQPAAANHRNAKMEALVGADKQPRAVLRRESHAEIVEVAALHSAMRRAGFSVQAVIATLRPTTHDPERADQRPPDYDT